MSAEVKPGYKQTEVGVIPEDWDVRLLGQLVHAVEYGSSAKSSPTGKVPVLRMGNLQEGKIDWSDLVFTDDDNEIAKYSLNPGDVLFNRTNTVDLVGKTAIFKGERTAIFAGYLIKIKEKKGLIDSRYLNYTLNSEPAKNHGLKVLSVAVGQANINGQKLKTYPIPLPPTVDEQCSIVAAISEMEDFISSLDQMIAKKRDIQQATMQQLLTGQRRLPGFTGEWEVGRLGDFGRCLRGVSYKGDADLFPYDNDETYRLLRSNNVQQSAIVTDGLQFVNARCVSDHQILKPDDILICMANGSKELVGKAGLFKVSDGHEYTFGAFMGCFRIAANAVPNFIFALFGTHKFKSYIANLLAGSSINNLRPCDIEKMEFSFPLKSEQTAIASILSDVDTELTTLEARREKAHQLKQGMMQELLTGRIRLA